MRVAESEGGYAVEKQPAAARAILVLEAQSDRAQAMQGALERRGYRCMSLTTIEEAFFWLATETFDLVIIGSHAPGYGGKGMLGVLQGRFQHVAKLALGPRDSSTHFVAALAQGADDVASFDLSDAELIARVEALLERNAEKATLRKCIGNLTIDIGMRRVWLGSREILLTAREFELFLYLIQHVNEVVTPEKLARDVWREPNRVTPLQSVIYVHVSNLRRKLKQNGATDAILSVRGVGYRVSTSLFAGSEG